MASCGYSKVLSEKRGGGKLRFRPVSIRIPQGLGRNGSSGTKKRWHLEIFSKSTILLQRPQAAGTVQYLKSCRRRWLGNNERFCLLVLNDYSNDPESCGCSPKGNNLTRKPTPFSTRVAETERERDRKKAKTCTNTAVKGL